MDDSQTLSYVRRRQRVRPVLKRAVFLYNESIEPMSEINKKSLEHLADLARLELTEKEEEKFLTDLGKILNHFEELQDLDTENVALMTGGTSLKNIFREDGATESTLGPDKVVEQFPDKEKHWLKVPPIFE